MLGVASIHKHLNLQRTILTARLEEVGEFSLPSKSPLSIRMNSVMRSVSEVHEGREKYSAVKTTDLWKEEVVTLLVGNHLLPQQPISTQTTRLPV